MLLAIVLIHVPARLVAADLPPDTDSPAIAGIEAIERDLDRLDSAPDVRETDRTITDLPEDGSVVPTGKVRAAESIEVQRVRHWKEDASPYGMSFSGPGLVSIELPTQTDEPVSDQESEILFATFSIKPALSSDPNELAYLNVLGAVLGFGLEPPTMGIRAGRFFVLNGDARRARHSDWINGRVSYAVNENFEAALPLDFELRIDVKRGEWDLFFRQRLLYAGIFHEGRAKGIWFRSAGEGGTAISELALTASNPLFDDQDADGIDDEVEAELGFSVTVNDRSALDELGQFTNLQHFINRRKTYASRAQVELEATLVEAIAVQKEGKGWGHLEELVLPEEKRGPHFSSREEYVRARAEARRERTPIGRNDPAPAIAPGTEGRTP